MHRKFYNSEDLEVLLRLKRQEADALRDVLRSINMSQIKTRQIFKIAQNTLLAQIGVRKISFIYRDEEGLQYGMQRGLSPLGTDAELELPDNLRVLRIEPAVHASLHALGVQYVVPVNYRNEVNAWFLVADFADSEAETENDLIFIETIGNIISTALENRRLISEIVEQESIKRELEVAERIQQQLLPSDFSVVKEADIYACNFAHHKIGGDYFDVISRSQNGFFIIIADVAGKGIGAALLMANLQANLRALILSEDSLETLVRKLHTLLVKVTQGEKFVTFFIAHVRTDAQEIDFINAGHNAPVMLQNGKISELAAGTIPLGIVDLPYVTEEAISYQPGDAMFLYTDGLVEQLDTSAQMLGEKRVYDRLLTSRAYSAKDIVEDMHEFYLDFSHKAIQEDDLTLMAVRF